MYTIPINSIQVIGEKRMGMINKRLIHPLIVVKITLLNDKLFREIRLKIVSCLFI